MRRTRRSSTRCEKKMDATVADARHKLATVRTGRASLAHLRRRDGRLLRHADAAEPGGQAVDPRADDGRGPAVRSLGAARDREGDPGRRPGAEPGQRRQARPHPDPAADRGAPQAAGQEGARAGRGRARPRCASCAARPTKSSRSSRRTASSPRTTRAARSTRSRSRPTSTSADIDDLCEEQGKGADGGLGCAVDGAAGIVVAAGRSERSGRRSFPSSSPAWRRGTVLDARGARAVPRPPRARASCVVLPEEEISAERGRARAPLSPGCRRVVAGGATPRRFGARGASSGGRPQLRAGARRGTAARLRARSCARCSRPPCADGAAVPVVPVRDTVKEDDGATVSPRARSPRGALRLAQTPQGSRRDWLLEALQTAMRDGARGHRRGAGARAARAGACAWSPGDPGNLKITTPRTWTRRAGGVAAVRANRRVGNGYDVHRFGAGRRAGAGRRRLPGRARPGRPLRRRRGAARGDGRRAGRRRPPRHRRCTSRPEDPRCEGADSRALARDVARPSCAAPASSIVNIDLTVLRRAPAHRRRTRARCARAIAARLRDRRRRACRVKATTLEGLGALGRAEGIACQAVGAASARWSAVSAARALRALADGLAPPGERAHRAVQLARGAQGRRDASSCASRTPTPRASRRGARRRSSRTCAGSDLTGTRGRTSAGRTVPTASPSAPRATRRPRERLLGDRAAPIRCFCSDEALAKRARGAAAPPACRRATRARAARSPRRSPRRAPPRASRSPCASACSPSKPSAGGPARGLRRPPARARSSSRRAELGDPVLLRRDGRPTYNFAVVVDDAAMGIDLVLRGDDHLSNTPRQVLLCSRARARRSRSSRTCRWCCGPDGERLSKRHGATSVGRVPARRAIPPEAPAQRARRCWDGRRGDERTIVSVGELVAEFDLDRVGARRPSSIPSKLDVDLGPAHPRAWPRGRLRREVGGAPGQRRTWLPAAPAADGRGLARGSSPRSLRTAARALRPGRRPRRAAVRAGRRARRCEAARACWRASGAPRVLDALAGRSGARRRPPTRRESWRALRRPRSSGHGAQGQGAVPAGPRGPDRARRTGPSSTALVPLDRPAGTRCSRTASPRWRAASRRTAAWMAARREARDDDARPGVRLRRAPGLEALERAGARSSACSWRARGPRARWAACCGRRARPGSRSATSRGEVLARKAGETGGPPGGRGRSWPPLPYADPDALCAQAAARAATGTARRCSTGSTIPGTWGRSCARRRRPGPTGCCSGRRSTVGLTPAASKTPPGPLERIAGRPRAAAGAAPRLAGGSRVPLRGARPRGERRWDRGRPDRPAGPGRRGGGARGCGGALLDTGGAPRRAPAGRGVESLNVSVAVGRGPVRGGPAARSRAELDPLKGLGARC